MADSVTDTTFIRTEAQLLVTDIDRSIRFYTSAVGFDFQFSYGEPPYYAQVGRQGALLNLRLVDAMPLRHEVVLAESLLSATVCLSGIESFASTLESKGVPLAQPLRTEPWGSKTLIVIDPDGNLVLFVE